jgi:hypothetical protein
MLAALMDFTIYGIPFTLKVSRQVRDMRLLV